MIPDSEQTEDQRGALAVVEGKLAICRVAVDVPCQARVMRYDDWTDSDGVTHNGFETIEIRFGNPFSNAVTIDSECFDLYRKDPTSFGYLIDDAIDGGTIDFMKHKGMIRK